MNYSVFEKRVRLTIYDDSKSQVSIRHEDGKPVAIETVVISHQTDEVPLENA